MSSIYFVVVFCLFLPILSPLLHFLLRCYLKRKFFLELIEYDRPGYLSFSNIRIRWENGIELKCNHVIFRIRMFLSNTHDLVNVALENVEVIYEESTNNPKGPSTEEFVKRLWSGDDESFQEFHEFYEDELSKFATFLSKLYRCLTIFSYFHNRYFRLTMERFNFRYVNEINGQIRIELNNLNFVNENDTKLREYQLSIDRQVIWLDEKWKNVKKEENLEESKNLLKIIGNKLSIKCSCLREVLVEFSKLRKNIYLKRKRNLGEIDGKKNYLDELIHSHKHKFLYKSACLLNEMLIEEESIHITIPVDDDNDMDRLSEILKMFRSQVKNKTEINSFIKHVGQLRLISHLIHLIVDFRLIIHKFFIEIGTKLPLDIYRGIEYEMEKIDIQFIHRMKELNVNHRYEQSRLRSILSYYIFHWHHMPINSNEKCGQDDGKILFSEFNLIFKLTSFHLNDNWKLNRRQSRIDSLNIIIDCNNHEERLELTSNCEEIVWILSNRFQKGNKSNSIQISKWETIEEMLKLFRFYKVKIGGNRMELLLPLSVSFDDLCFFSNDFQLNLFNNSQWKYKGILKSNNFSIENYLLRKRCLGRNNSSNFDYSTHQFNSFFDVRQIGCQLNYDLNNRNGDIISFLDNVRFEYNLMNEKIFQILLQKNNDENDENELNSNKNYLSKIFRLSKWNLILDMKEIFIIYNCHQPIYLLYQIDYLVMEKCHFNSINQLACRKMKLFCSNDIGSDKNSTVILPPKQSYDIFKLSSTFPQHSSTYTTKHLEMDSLIFDYDSKAEIFDFNMRYCRQLKVSSMNELRDLRREFGGEELPNNSDHNNQITISCHRDFHLLWMYFLKDLHQFRRLITKKFSNSQTKSKRKRIYVMFPLIVKFHLLMNDGFSMVFVLDNLLVKRYWKEYEYIDYMMAVSNIRLYFQDRRIVFLSNVQLIRSHLNRLEEENSFKIFGKKLNEKRKLISNGITVENNCWIVDIANIFFTFPSRFDFASAYNEWSKYLKWRKQVLLQHFHQNSSNSNNEPIISLPRDCFLKIHQFIFSIEDDWFDIFIGTSYRQKKKEMELREDSDILEEKFKKKKKKKQNFSDNELETGTYVTAKTGHKSFSSKDTSRTTSIPNGTTTNTTTTTTTTTTTSGNDWEKMSKSFIRHFREVVEDEHNRYNEEQFNFRDTLNCENCDVFKWNGFTRPLFVWRMVNFDLYVLVDETLNGKENVLKLMKDVDENCEHLSLEKDSFNIMWARFVELSLTEFRLNFRDYPQHLNQMKNMIIRGRFGASESIGPQYAFHQFQLMMCSPWDDMVIERNLMPLKYYYDLDWNVEYAQFSYGPCWESVMADLNLAFDDIFRSSIDRSPPLPWWDKLRLLYHGTHRIHMKKLYYLYHLSLDPYSNNERMQFNFDDLLWKIVNANWSYDTKRLVVLVRSAPRYDNFRLINLPELSLNIRLGWICRQEMPKNSKFFLKNNPTFLNRSNHGGSNNHNNVIRCTPQRLQAVNFHSHDSYLWFRSRKLNVQLDIVCENVSNNPATILLRSSTFRFIERMKILLTNVTRPIRRGKLFNNFKPKKTPLGRHYDKFNLNLKIPSVTVVYRSSFSEQLGFMLTTESMTAELLMRLHLTKRKNEEMLLTKNKKLIISSTNSLKNRTNSLKRRPRAIWKVSETKVNIARSILFLTKCQGEEGIKQLLFPERSFLLEIGSMEYRTELWKKDFRIYQTSNDADSSTVTCSHHCSVNNIQNQSLINNNLKLNESSPKKNGHHSSFLSKSNRMKQIIDAKIIGKKMFGYSSERANTFSQIIDTLDDKNRRYKPEMRKTSVIEHSTLPPKPNTKLNCGKCLKHHHHHAQKQRSDSSSLSISSFQSSKYHRNIAQISNVKVHWDKHNSEVIDCLILSLRKIRDFRYYLSTDALKWIRLTKSEKENENVNNIHSNENDDDDDDDDDNDDDINIDEKEKWTLEKNDFKNYRTRNQSATFHYDDSDDDYHKDERLKERRHNISDDRLNDHRRRSSNHLLNHLTDARSHQTIYDNENEDDFCCKNKMARGESFEKEIEIDEGKLEKLEKKNPKSKCDHHRHQYTSKHLHGIDLCQMNDEIEKNFDIKFNNIQILVQGVETFTRKHVLLVASELNVKSFRHSLLVDESENHLKLLRKNTFQGSVSKMSCFSVKDEIFRNECERVVHLRGCRNQFFKKMDNKLIAAAFLPHLDNAKEIVVTLPASSTVWLTDEQMNESLMGYNVVTGEGKHNQSYKNQMSNSFGAEFYIIKFEEVIEKSEIDGIELEYLKKHRTTPHENELESANTATVILHDVEMTTDNKEFQLLYDIMTNLILHTEAVKKDEMERLKCERLSWMLRSNQEQRTEILSLKDHCKTLLRQRRHLENAFYDLQEESASNIVTDDHLTELVHSSNRSRFDENDEEKKMKEKGIEKKFLSKELRDIFIQYKCCTNSIDISKWSHFPKKKKEMIINECYQLLKRQLAVSADNIGNRVNWYKETMNIKDPNDNEKEKKEEKNPLKSRHEIHVRSALLNVHSTETKYETQRGKFSLKSFRYIKRSFEDNKKEHRFELDYADITDNSLGVESSEVLIPMKMDAISGLPRNLVKQPKDGQLPMVHALIKERPPVGGIPIIEQLAVNIVPIRLYIEHVFSDFLINFFVNGRIERADAKIIPTYLGSLVILQDAHNMFHIKQRKIHVNSMNNEHILTNSQLISSTTDPKMAIIVDYPDTNSIHTEKDAASNYDSYSLKGLDTNNGRRSKFLKRFHDRHRHRQSQEHLPQTETESFQNTLSFNENDENENDYSNMKHEIENDGNDQKYLNDQNMIEIMHDRLINTTFAHIYIGDIPLLLTYKSSKHFKNLNDIHVLLPAFERTNVVWTWMDFIDNFKNDARRHLKTQAIKGKISSQLTDLRNYFRLKKSSENKSAKIKKTKRLFRTKNFKVNSDYNLSNLNNLSSECLSRADPTRNALGFSDMGMEKKKITHRTNRSLSPNRTNDKSSTNLFKTLNQCYYP
ncbi:hypothetical protein SNEBB_007609 [Seison nebaliae]|nr:hypothetical protein SNEBB_007609 [Seison nebaliae]